MMPPLALISSTASVPPHRTPSPVIAAGPLIAEAKPMRMGGGAWAAATGGSAASRATRSASRMRMTASLRLLEVGNDLAPEQVDRLLQLGHGVGDEEDPGAGGHARALVGADALADLLGAADQVALLEAAG